jgi:alkylhydroperoxidase family enzyme
MSSKEGRVDSVGLAPTNCFDRRQCHLAKRAHAQEIVELSWAIATINAWNRMAAGMGMLVAQEARSDLARKAPACH